MILLSTILSFSSGFQFQVWVEDWQWKFPDLPLPSLFFAPRFCNLPRSFQHTRQNWNLFQIFLSSLKTYCMNGFTRWPLPEITLQAVMVIQQFWSNLNDSTGWGGSQRYQRLVEIQCRQLSSRINQNYLWRICECQKLQRVGQEGQHWWIPCWRSIPQTWICWNHQCQGLKYCLASLQSLTEDNT